ncbi:helix-turn-helix transcriptional regulator [Clostridium sp. YIM B02505]|uniref:Helix-turn-helix transcriptional regulator n=1 Tax=Clostridium yunnanense TaxID=2800325 RepID=A0ABS1ELL6_9CLOT|nr:helix-turn-helix transcriptional regulator [Clostridium yunnanense]MBK1810235.1 helix-turn-helix transcriptional regulator [Clostridium yunnanense]
MGNLNGWLKLRRSELNLSLRDAAKLIGISHSYLSTLEKGVDPRNVLAVKPTPETLKLISSTYDVPYDFVMTLSGYYELKYSEDSLVIQDDEKEVETLLNKVKYIFMEDDDLTLSGEPITKEALESIIDALNYGVSQAKKINTKFKSRKDANELRL